MRIDTVIKSRYFVIAMTVAIFFVVLLGIFFAADHLKPKVQSEQTDVKKDFEEAEEAPSLFSDFQEPRFPDRVCNISKYGAVGDGIFMNTLAFSEAISDCAKLGGGTVNVPKGKWLTGPVHIASNINLHIEKDAEIIFSKNFKDYLPVVFTRFEGMELMNYSPLIYANGCENVAITGEGKINGQGEAWDHWNGNQEDAVLKLYEMANSNVPVEKRIFGTEQDYLRPSFTQFANCKDILISGVTFINGPMWTIHQLYSENIKITGIKVDTTGHNTDGIVVDSSKNVIIENSEFETGDDCIAIKSGLDADGWRVNRPSENIVVRNCVMKMGHSGVAVGSEMSGGVRDVLIRDSSFKNIDYGFRIKTLKGRGGFIKNIRMENIEMDNIIDTAVQVSMDYPSYTIIPQTDKLPVVRNVYFSNVKGSDIGQAIELEGLSRQPLENIVFSDISFKSSRGISLDETKKITFQDVDIAVKKDFVWRINDGKDVLIEKIICRQKKGKCFYISGSVSSKIKIQDVDYSGIKEKVEISKEVERDEVFIEK